MDKQDFLIEIGTEELPAKGLQRLSENFAQNIAAQLQKEKLSYVNVKSFVTPRRLAILVEQLITSQESRHIEKRGPAVQAAFDKEGKPTKACEGFAKSCGVKVENLERLKTDKGEWLIYHTEQQGKATVELLAEIVTQALKRLPIKRCMRWGDHSIEFLRPVHWVLMLFGEQVVDTEILGIKTSAETRGHRYHAPDAISINKPSQYVDSLREKGRVIADFAERRDLIREQIALQASRKNATVIENNDLLNEVTGLVEWPAAILASFDKKFLEVPSEVLIESMCDHQKCFSLCDTNKKLMPHFITVSNIESHDLEEVVKGNERVMRARLSDAAFFFERDRKVPLTEYLEACKHVVYQAKLGSLYDKAQRLESISADIAGAINADKDKTRRAALLSKCDLMTDMVGEFPKLQGVMGRYYAAYSGEDEAVAEAIEEHYLPRYSGDKLPQTLLGSAVALAERFDNLVGCFGINEIPTGEKDPFCLRRSALGIVRIIIENKFHLDISLLLKKTLAQYSAELQNKEALSQVEAFIIDRLKSWYLDQGVSSNVISAVLAKQKNDLYDFHQRIKAVEVFSQLPEASALAAANKRVSKILQKEKQHVGSITINTKLLKMPAEQALAESLTSLQEKVSPLIASSEYTKVLQQLASLRAPVDTFFDDVMVMSDDKKLRQNRLALLTALRSLFLNVADVSLL